MTDSPEHQHQLQALIGWDLCLRNKHLLPPGSILGPPMLMYLTSTSPKAVVHTLPQSLLQRREEMMNRVRQINESRAIRMANTSSTTKKPATVSLTKTQKTTANKRKRPLPKSQKAPERKKKKPKLV